MIYTLPIDYTKNDYSNNRPIAALVSFSNENIVKDFFSKNLKWEELRKDIGEDLFESLSEEDKDFILKTEGSVNFGYKISSTNLHEIEKILREDYEY